MGQDGAIIYRDSRYNSNMKIHIPNSAFLGNIDPFLKGFDPSSPDFLEITANEKWISAHPVVLSMIGALGLAMNPEKIRKSIATASRDFFILYSGSGFYKLLKNSPLRKFRLHADPFEDRHSRDGAFPAWQGTVVGMDLTLDQTVDFSLLLDAIRKTYTLAVRERKGSQRKRPRFIP